ncbi:MAG: hypothetical protein ACPMAQ_13650, partial [Phycisphaerae bacterium]
MRQRISARAGRSDDIVDLTNMDSEEILKIYSK